MTETAEIKHQVKEALIEFFSEENSLLRDVVSELMEDIALGKAIEAGDVGDYVEEDLIFALLAKED